MEVTTDIIKEIFLKYQDAFDRSLPMPEFKLCHSYRTTGEFNYRLWQNGTMRGQKISVSDYFDWDEVELESVVVHEMIHYHIYYHKIKDTATHGEKFLELALKFNEKYGLHITPIVDISHFKRAPKAPKLSWIAMNIFG